MSDKRSVVEFYFGVGSRYSYLAASQLGRVARETGAQFLWRPVSAPDLFDAGRNPFAGQPVSGQYDWAYRQADAEAWAEYYGIPFIEPRGRLDLDGHLLARACIAGGRLGSIETVSWRLMRAIYTEPRTSFGRDEIADCAAEIGLDRRRFLESLDDPQTEVERLTLVAQARSHGVFGVPTFLVGNGRLIFGNDRLVLLEHALRTAGTAR